jgi:hypothetical protein
MALGRKEESIREGQRAVEIRPISEDAVDGPMLAFDLAYLYAVPISQTIPNFFTRFWKCRGKT